MIADGLPRLGTLFLALLLSGCSALGRGAVASPIPVSGSTLESASLLVERGSFTDAEGTLRETASMCTSGEVGRRSLLMLAAIRLDPRNPAQNADSAAVMAIRYLALPGGDPTDRALASSIYTLALDLGADPLLRPSFAASPGAISPRFTDCDAPPPSNAPELPRLLIEARAEKLHERTQQRDSASAEAARLADLNKALEKKIQDLEAELQRVRRLLGGTPPKPPAKEDAGPLQPR